MLEIPAVVAEKARVHSAEGWLTSLPSLVDEICTDWGLTLGLVHGGGTESLVVDVERADGSAAVLKVHIPRPGDHAALEIAALRLIAGDGAVRLLEADDSRHALLTERLGPSMADLALPMARRHELLCATAARIWRPCADERFPTGADKGRWLIDFIVDRWATLDRPCSEAAIDHAVACAERRISAHDDERAVLVHGDVHQWNALRADDGFKLIDPDGLRAEPEYDLGVLMREDPEEFDRVDPWERAHRLAEWAGCDVTAIWEWGVVERVSTGLLATEIGLQPAGRRMLAVADRIAPD